MMIKINNLRKNQKGFTLIELLVVIAIIAILAAIIAPRVVQSLDSAKTSSAGAMKDNLNNALERYSYDNNNAYPPATTGTASDLDGLYPKYLTDKPSNSSFSIRYQLDTTQTPNVPTVTVTKN